MLLPIAIVAHIQRTQDLYTKHEYMIPMRDGKRLYTSVYVPKKPGKHPILLERTPYSAGPYGPNAYVDGIRGSQKFKEAGYIFAFQDVRGTYLSEGDFVDVRPQLQIHLKPQDIDESTDSYDTVDYLVKKVPQNNGRVGLWGVSYPGFYAAAGAINSHPALKAASPQAPVSDWFIGDDFHHNGVLFVQDAFSFYSGFGQARPVPSATMKPGPAWDEGGNAFNWYLKMGALPNFDSKVLKGSVRFWNDLMAHPNYDDFWQSRSLPRQMKNVRCAVLGVGGMFDAEDCWGAQNVYKYTHVQNPKTPTYFAMGPWYHGGWEDYGFDSLGALKFPGGLSAHFEDDVEFPFFDAYLRGNGKCNLPTATVYETGANRWRHFFSWPPVERHATNLYLDNGHAVAFNKPSNSGSESYISDPADPVPYHAGAITDRTREYMVDDQSFLKDRKDVVSYEMPPLIGDITIAGPVSPDLFVKTSSTDADFVVKLIDVGPTGYQGIIRADTMRAKFRNSFQNPSPLTPGKVEEIKFTMTDVLHTFKKGHRIMIQIQSSWFPLTDRNPQVFEDINQAKDTDFQKATIEILHSPQHPSHVEVGLMPNPGSNR